MTAPSGSELQLRWGFEIREGVYDPALLENHMRAMSVTGLAPKRTSTASKNMDPSRMTLRGQQTKAEVAPKIANESCADDLPRLFAHFCNTDPVITPVGDYFDWVSEPHMPGDTAPVRYINSIAWEGNDGDGYPVLALGNRLTDIGVKITANQFNGFSFDFLGTFDTYTADADPLVGPATYTGTPIMRGHWLRTATG